MNGSTNRRSGSEKSPLARAMMATFSQISENKTASKQEKERLKASALQHLDDI